MTLSENHWTSGIEIQEGFHLFYNHIPDLIILKLEATPYSKILIVMFWNRSYKVYRKLIGENLWTELSVWMRNCRRENHFDLDCAKNKNKTSKNKKTS